MALIPKIDTDFGKQRCDKCGREYDSRMFIKSKSPIFPHGYTCTCLKCLNEVLESDEYSWDIADKVCQYVDIPFIPAKWEETLDTNERGLAFMAYSHLFDDEQYDGIDWKSYYDAYKELKENGALDDVVPLVKEEERHKLQERWGYNYDDEALNYLENLYNGLLLTQNINGALQGDQALKICKVSYEIDCRIQAGEDFDKLLASYDKLVKTGEFTPKNTKNAGDFESFGEVSGWLEKKGIENVFYDGVTRDVVDETLKNIQSWNQYLYTNESGIGDEITERINSLRQAAKLENYGLYDLNAGDVDENDKYENEGFEIEEEFNPILEE